MKLIHFSSILVMLASILIVTSLLIAPSTAGDLLVYDSTKPVGAFKNIYVGPGQRCYTFSCFSDVSSTVTWQHMQTYAWMIFYSDSGCRGGTVNGDGNKGTIYLKDGRLDNKIASAMLWESGAYPTRGFIDICPEERERNCVLAPPRIAVAGALIPVWEHTVKARPRSVDLDWFSFSNRQALCWFKPNAKSWTR